MVDSTAGTPAVCTDNSSPPDGDCDDPGDVNTPAGSASHPNCASLQVGQQTVPVGLRSLGGGQPRLASGRDSGNNIVVYWASANPPSDNSQCWMYVSRLNAWAVAN